MLTALQISNFAIIDHLEIDFTDQLTVLTGETGAGKSIIIDALELALGGRAENHFIQHTKERAEVTATFNIATINAAKTWLKEHDFTSDDSNELILRRIINRDGPSKSTINGHPAPLQQIREVSALLINIHGQHEHQTLLKNEKQRELLDGFAQNEALLSAVANAYTKWLNTKNELTSFQNLNQNREGQLALIRHELRELEVLALQKDEYANLNQEYRSLSNAEQILTTSQLAMNLTVENENSAALNNLYQAKKHLEKISGYHEKLNSAVQLFQSAALNIESAADEIRQYLNAAELNGERFKQVEERLNLIHTLARKHNVKEDELIAIQKRLEENLMTLESLDDNLKKLRANEELFAKEYLCHAEKLSNSRKNAAKKIGVLVSQKIQELNLGGGKFEVALNQLNGDAKFSPLGLEAVDFLVATNPGTPLLPLNKIASGGEISRIGLAIQVVTATKNRTIPIASIISKNTTVDSSSLGMRLGGKERASGVYTDINEHCERHSQQRRNPKCEGSTMVFDEVDVGIGGKTAEIVGKLLRELAKNTQIICITHLPQVATQGNHHLVIEKIHAAKTTNLTVTPLSKEKRVHEIARMLGGIEITAKTLAHAKELLKTSG